MKYLVTILILLFASPAFAGGNFSAFGGANSSSAEIESVDNETYQDPEIIQSNPVAKQGSEFRINERLYYESIGSYGYYGGGYYGEERYAAQIPYYEVTSSHSDSGFATGLVVVHDQLIQTNVASPFVTPFIRGGVIFNSGIGFGHGGFGFGHGGFGFGVGGFGLGHH